MLQIKCMNILVKSLSVFAKMNATWLSFGDNSTLFQVIRQQTITWANIVPLIMKIQGAPYANIYFNLSMEK